jgi:hypothetical protein
MDFIGNVAQNYKGRFSMDAERDACRRVKHRLQALISIAKAPYWSRLWVVQEVMLGDDRVFLHLRSRILHYTTEAIPALDGS